MLSTVIAVFLLVIVAAFFKMCVTIYNALVSLRAQVERAWSNIDVILKQRFDELPQLINVLRGDMSLVGPRPHATQMRVGDKFYFDAVRGYAARHRVKPGITGLAQVRGLRGEIATIERARKRIEYDVYYIENWSPLLDARIIVETMYKVIWDRHAY